MLKKILKFIFSKEDVGIYSHITILGIKITTKPFRLKIENRFNDVDSNINDIKSNINDIKLNINDIKLNINDIKSNINDIKLHLKNIDNVMSTRHTELNIRFDQMYPFMWDRHNQLINNLYNIHRDILISRVLNYQISPLYDNNSINKKLENNILVSVIVTVYNIGEKYLVRCLESIINQTLKNIEIIIVNDCSPLEEDDKICLYYKEMDNRIKYIKLENNIGDGLARMEGLKVANGYAVSFVDADDYLSLNLYYIAVNEMLKNDLEIVIYNFFIIRENNSNIEFVNSYYHDLPYTIFYNEEVLNIFCNLQVYISGHLWNKLFRKDILLKLGFDNIPARYRCKDLSYTFKIFYNAKKISYIPLNLYFYEENRSTSIVNTNMYKDSYFTDMYYIYTDIYEYINKYSNDTITKLFASNFGWIYYSALEFDEKKISDEKHFINLFGKIILDLENYGAIDKNQLINNIKSVYHNYNIINWIEELFNNKK